MKILIYTLLTLFLTKLAYQAGPKELYIFKFDSKGYTTASASSEFISLHLSEQNPIKITEDEQIVFDDILSTTLPKKHVQGKLGTNLLFCGLIQNSKKYNLIISKKLIINLSRRTEYEIVYERHLTWINKFIKKYQSHYAVSE